MSLGSRPTRDTENIQIFRFDYFLFFFSLLRHISAFFIRSFFFVICISCSDVWLPSCCCLVSVRVLVALLYTRMHQYIHWRIIIFVRSALFIHALCVETLESEKCRYLFINILFFLPLLLFGAGRVLLVAWISFCVFCRRVWNYGGAVFQHFIAIKRSQHIVANTFNRTNGKYANE